MKNIQITIISETKTIHEYISDIIPGVGDKIELEDNIIVQVTERIFLAKNNRVKILVKAPFGTML